jgi:hypothetical protein
METHLETLDRLSIKEKLVPTKAALKTIKENMILIRFERVR